MDIADGAVWSVYMLRCADDSLYTGIAIDIERRLEEHRRGARGAKYLRGRLPLSLVFHVAVGDRAAASRMEYRIKQLTKAEKERLVLVPNDLRTLTATSR